MNQEINESKILLNEYSDLYLGVIYDAMKFDLKLNNFIIPRTAGPIIPV
jgi:hypothetical protein